MFSHCTSLKSVAVLFIFYFCLDTLFYFWLCRVFFALHELSLVAASTGYSPLQCPGFSLRWVEGLWPQQLLTQWCGSPLWSMGSVVVVHRLSCQVISGIFPDQGLNLCALHWQVGFYPLCHQGSSSSCAFYNRYKMNEIFTSTLSFSSGGSLMHIITVS